MATDNQTTRKEIADVYNCIAQDFSNTRTKYNIWQSVRNFIEALPAGSHVADIGCGNGKNMQLRSEDITYHGMDISEEMVNICQARGFNVVQGDILQIPFADDCVDACISIAVIHHLTTRDERIAGIRELIRITKPGGKILIYVWAFEQPAGSKRKFTSYDEMVPFINKDGTTHYRYYHLYTDGELHGEVMEANPTLNVIDSHMEMGNYVIIAENA
jgi:ubiquinone/menaquinone biosynthesis C-methylase UbiE